MTVNAALKFNMKPGVRTSMNKTTTVPTLKSSNNTASTSGSTSTTKSTGINFTGYQAAQALKDPKTVRENVFQNMRYSDSPYVSGYKNQTTDKMHNVDYRKYGRHGFDQTSRSQNRQYANWAGFYNNNFVNSNQNRGNDFMAKIAMLNQVGKMAGSLTSKIASTKSSSSAASTASTGSGAPAKSTASAAQTISQELKGAKTSSEIQAALSKVDVQQEKLQKEIDSLQQTVNTELKAKDEAEKGIKDTTTQIEAENKNIQQQTGTITKLQSSISMDKTTLALKKRMLSTANDLTKTALQREIADLEAKIAESEQKLKEAQDSKAASENNIKNNLQPAKEQYETALETAKKNWGEAQSTLEDKKEELKDLDKTETEYNKKLNKKEEKEETKMADMHRDLANIAKSFQSETDSAKKSELQGKYRKLAAEYNAMVKNSSSNEYTEVGAELS